MFKNSCCFFCGSEKIKEHSLGRIYCLECRKRYSQKRITNAKKIIEYFALEVPANKASKFLNLNYKTVHRTYQDLRKRIETKTLDDLLPKNHEGKSFFVLIAEKDGVVLSRIIKQIPEYEKLIKKLESKEFKANIFSTDNFKSFKSLEKVHSGGLESFWLYAKIRLEKYQAVSRKNLQLYLNELCFRYNHKNKNLLNALLRLWQKVPNS